MSCSATRTSCGKEACSSAELCPCRGNTLPNKARKEDGQLVRPTQMPPCGHQCRRTGRSRRGAYAWSTGIPLRRGARSSPTCATASSSSTVRPPAVSRRQAVAITGALVSESALLRIPAAALRASWPSRLPLLLPEPFCLHLMGSVARAGLR